MKHFALLPGVLIFGALCSQAVVAQDPSAEEGKASQAPSEKPRAKSVGLANPASVNCGKKGGKLEIRKGRKGEYGVCKFPNGKECEEWALFRGKCSPDDKVAPPRPPEK